MSESRTLAAALGVKRDEVVALVGGGGKSAAMFRLAREAAEGDGRTITTTTTHIFGSQTGLAPAHLLDADATRERLVAELDRHRHVLVTGPTNPETRRAAGISLDRFRELRGWCPDACLITEADGSRMLPFKAPAAYEPVIPAETTLVLVLVGADVLGRPLDADHVHRPERVSALTGAPLGASVTPAIVAGVLTHAQGGRKGVPPGARLVVLINKVETLADPAPARETGERLLARARHRGGAPDRAAGRESPSPGGLDAMTTTVDTALGPIPTVDLGPTLMHEHIVTRSPGVQENWPISGTARASWPSASGR